MQVQLFEMTSVGGSEDLYRFKSTLNQWLEKESDKVEVKHILQSLVEKQGALSCIVSIWYDKKQQSGSSNLSGAASEIETGFV